MKSYAAVNINPKTKIHYGIVSLRNIDSEIIMDELYSSNAIDFNQLESTINEIKKVNSAFTLPERGEDECYFDYWKKCQTIAEETFFNLSIEPLDDACDDFWNGIVKIENVVMLVNCEYDICTVIDSPVVVNANVCSPCFPNAGDLDNLIDSGIETYGIPADWYI